MIAVATEMIGSLGIDVDVEDAHKISLSISLH
jgi:hypothetical protein